MRPRASNWRSRARIESTVDADRPLASEPEVAAVEVVALIKLQTHKHLDGLLKAFAEANTLRRWVRDIHPA